MDAASGRKDDRTMKKLLITSLALLAASFLAVSAYAAERTFTVNMSGKAETPKGDPNGTGKATIKIEQSKGELCFTLSWSRIGTPVAAHIHKGRKGVAGPVVIPLFGGAAKHKGCVKASKSLLGKIVKSPASYYVNVHTQAFPAGAIRAQL